MREEREGKRENWREYIYIKVYVYIYVSSEYFKE